MHLPALWSAGTPSIRTDDAPGVHGAVVTGMHGCGVSTPKAAAVAAATCGLARLVHNPKGETLRSATWFRIDAAGLPPAVVATDGNIVRLDELVPSEQLSCALLTTWVGNLASC
jgi:hypothetical protein